MRSLLLIVGVLVTSIWIHAQELDSSARLLESLLGETKSVPVVSAPQEGMTVKIYQLAQLKIEAANGQRATDVLRRWLPPGSTVSAVPATNSLHILTTPTAHQAVAELLATLDQAPAVGPSLDPRLKDAMEKFSEVSAQPKELRRLLDDSFAKLHAEWLSLQTATAENHHQEERRFFYLAAGVSATIVLCVAVTLFWIARKKPSDIPLALAPQQLTLAIQPLRGEVHRQLELMSSDMKQVVETALQVHRQSEAQRSSELAGLRTQLESYLNKREVVLEQSRVEMEKTATRLNASADAIQVSQVKVEALTNQLRGAMHEIDRLQNMVSEREENLQHQSELLRAKEDEMSETRAQLSRNLAKLALLAKELGVDDSFFATPLPEFDRMVDGKASEESAPAPEASLAVTPSLEEVEAPLCSVVAESSEPYLAAPPIIEEPSPLAPGEKEEPWPDVAFHDPAKV